MKASVLQGVHFVCQLSGYTSLTSAAKALNLTVGAISQQLQKSEQDLGFSVFERHARGIRLTDKGRQLVKTTQPYFTSIENCVNKISKHHERQEVYLKLTPSFAFKWLVPRLEVFHRMHPDIQIHTFAEGAIVDSESRDFDLAIDYGKIPYQKNDAELLMQETLTVVMSAEYFARHRFEGNDWQGVTLLHDAMPWHDAAKDYEWSYWAKKNHLTFDTTGGHFFNRTDMAMSAAEAGVGVALARGALLGNELEQGKLIAPFGSIDAHAGYFMLTQNESCAVRHFKSWLKEQVKGSEINHTP